MAHAAETLLGRAAEGAAVDRLLAGAARGAGGALVLYGGPGSGRTALLGWVRDRAGDVVDLHTAAVPAESRLPGAGLHRLLAPVRPLAATLPRGQATALRRVLGERPGRPDPLVLGTALLDLLTAAAAAAGAGRPVLARVDDAELLDPLSLAALGFVGRRLAGTPVALVLATDGAPAPGGPLAGLPALPLRPLDPAAARRVLVAALARRGLPGAPEHVLAAILDRAAGNPLALVERAAAVADRPPAVLAGELAAAALAAERAGDHPAASRCYERSAQLAGSPRTAGRRLLAAARSAWSAGDGPRARELLARTGPPANGGPAPAGLLRAEIELRSGTVPGAYDALAPVAAGLDRAGGPASPGGRAAVAALLQASEVIELAGDHGRFAALAERVGGLGPAADPATRLVVAHFTGLAAAYRGQHGRAADPLRRVLELAGPAGTPAALIGATVAAMTLSDDERSLAVAAQAVALTRAAAAAQLPASLGLLAFAEFRAGRYAAAATHAEEGLRRARELGQDNTAAAHLGILALLAAPTGDRDAALAGARAAARQASSRGVTRPLALTTWARVRLALATGSGGSPVSPATFRGMHPTIRVLATPDLVEAMVRQGDRDRAGALLAVFDRWATGTGSRPMRALAARCRGLLAGSDGAAADAYADALALHDSDGLERARTQLLYGRAVRHGRRPAAARGHLQEALAVFERLDAAPWVERTRAELRAAGAATGAPARPAGELTPQQWQVARLVAAGATNREVAAQLVLSTRTVEHHLRQVFVRLGVRSRVELTLRLAGRDR